MKTHNLTYALVAAMILAAGVTSMAQPSNTSAPERSGTLNAPAKFPIMAAGKEIGASTLPAGTKVAVIREEGGKTLVKASLGETWVESAAVAVEEQPQPAAGTNGNSPVNLVPDGKGGSYAQPGTAQAQLEKPTAKATPTVAPKPTPPFLKRGYDPSDNPEVLYVVLEKHTVKGTDLADEQDRYNIQCLKEAGYKVTPTYAKTGKLHAGGPTITKLKEMTGETNVMPVNEESSIDQYDIVFIGTGGRAWSEAMRPLFKKALASKKVIVVQACSVINPAFIYNIANGGPMWTDKPNTRESRVKREGRIVLFENDVVRRGEITTETVNGKPSRGQESTVETASTYEDVQSFFKKKLSKEIKTALESAQ